jgi:glucokinase
MEVIVGVDVGGTNTVIGLFNKSLSLLKKESIPTLITKEKDGHDFFDYVTFHILRILESIDESLHLLCVGMGVPGIVDSDSGIAHAAVNLGWSDLPMAIEMKHRLGIPVFIDNDVRAYTQGEVIAGSGQGKNNVICITLGTGIAAGILMNGSLIRGSHYYAGEIGHDRCPDIMYQCKCGKVGCLETVASGPGIVRLANEAIKSGKVTILKNSDTPFSAFDVYCAAIEGDQVAIDVFSQVGRTLGLKLVTITYLLNPETIVVGGGPAAAGDLLLNPIRQVFKEQYRYTNQFPDIITGSLGDSAGLIGSAYMAARLAQVQMEGRWVKVDL